MDTKKIGLFLAELRKEKKLTQQELGDIIGVTNKTVSRWENGNYLPPVEALVLLSNYYNISINEILSGKKLDHNEYKTQAEENIKTTLSSSVFTLQEKIAFFKRKWIKDHIFELVFEALIIIAIIVFLFIKNNDLKYLSLVLPYIYTIINHNKLKSYIEKSTYNHIDNENKFNNKDVLK